MRNLALAAASLVLAALVILPAPSDAAAANLVATAGVPVKLYGESSVRAHDGILSIQADGLPPDVVISAERILVERVRVASSYVPVASGLEAPGERHAESESFELSEAELRLVSRDNGLVLVAAGRNARLETHQTFPAEGAPSDLWIGAHAQVTTLLADRSYTAPLPRVRLGEASDARDDAVLVPARSYAATGRDAAASIDAATLLFYGGGLREAAHDVDLISGSRTEERSGSVYAAGAWTGPGTHREDVVEYYVLRLVEGRVEAHFASASLLADDLFVEHRGFVGFPWAEGRLETPTETHLLGGEQVILGGTLRFRPIGVALDGAPRITLLGDGDLDFVQLGVGREPLPAFGPAAAAAGAVAGLGLLGLLVYYWPAVQYGLGALLFPLYARVTKEETLDHKAREQLYDLIRAEPGVSTNHLAKAVSFGWSTLTYHLRVLERNEAIVSVRDGRYKRFFDRQSGRYSNGRKFVLAVLKNDATYDIARFIREKPGSSQKEVAGSFHLSPSSVHWHVERLSEVALVQKVRESHNVKYFPGEGWDHVTIEDLKALETAPAASAAAPVAAPAARDLPPAQA